MPKLVTLSLFMNEEEELNSMMSEMRDLEIVRDLLEDVIQLSKYSSRFNDNQTNEFKEHINAVYVNSKDKNQSRIKYHLTCARRILESARDWEI